MQSDHETFRDLAIEEWARDGEIEFDHDAQVSVSETSEGIIGAYVQAWVWIGTEGV